MSWQEKYYKMISDVRDQVWRAYSRELWTPVFLVYRPAAQGKWGELSVIQGDEPVPDGYELVTSERVPRNIERQALWMWIKDRTGNIPILGVGSGT